jgi:hypothetical protein
MARTCSFDNCNYSVFGTDKKTGKGYCKKHQYCRTDKNKSKKEVSLNRRNEKLKRNKHNFDPFKWGFTSEVSMFNVIWTMRMHKSEISDQIIYMTKFYLSYFAHIINKKDYPLYRYNPNNIMLMLPVEHLLIDHGTEEKREQYVKENPKADFSIFYKKKEKLIEEYNKININH